MAFEDTNEEMDIERMNELLALTDAPFRLRAEDDDEREDEELSIIGELTAGQMETCSKLMDVPFCHHSESTCSKEVEQLALRLRLQESERYKDFDVLEKPVPFREFAEKFADGANIDLVQLHDMTPVGESPDDVFGFCGACAWKDGALVSLDGDSYSDEMLVYGYEWFTAEEEGIEKGLDILVNEW